MKKVLAHLAGTLLLCFCAAAKAYVESPVLFPATPAPADQISIKVSAGYCDGFPGATDSAVVTASEGDIEVLLEAVHAPDGACNFPVFTCTFTLGMYPAGSYTVRVRRRYIDFFGSEVIETLGTLPLVIQPSAADVAAVPSVGWSFAGVLAAALAVIGALRSRRAFTAPRAMKTSQSIGILIASLMASFCSSPRVSAAAAVLPTDIDVRLTASPTTGLVPGQTVALTWSVTNNGPAPAPLFAVLSSDITNQFDVASATTDCPNMVRGVGDGEHVVYTYFWYPTLTEDLPVGATLSCHLYLPLSYQAPNIVSFTIALTSIFVDADIGNNSATVMLQRLFASVPTLSSDGVGFMALLLVALGIASRGSNATRALARKRS